MSSLTIDTSVNPKLETKQTPSNKLFTIGLSSETVGIVCAVACAILLLAGGPYSLMIGLAIGAAALLIAGTACILLSSSSRIITDETPKPFEEMKTPTPPTPLNLSELENLTTMPSYAATAATESTELLGSIDEEAAQATVNKDHSTLRLAQSQTEVQPNRPEVSQNGVSTQYFDSTSDNPLLFTFDSVQERTRICLRSSDDEERKYPDSQSSSISASASDQESTSPLNSAQVTPFHLPVTEKKGNSSASIEGARAQARVRQLLGHLHSTPATLSVCDDARDDAATPLSTDSNQGDDQIDDLDGLESTLKQRGRLREQILPSLSSSVSTSPSKTYLPFERGYGSLTPLSITSSDAEQEEDLLSDRDDQSASSSVLGSRPQSPLLLSATLSQPKYSETMPTYIAPSAVYASVERAELSVLEMEDDDFAELPSPSSSLSISPFSNYSPSVGDDDFLSSTDSEQEEDLLSDRDDQSASSSVLDSRLQTPPSFAPTLSQLKQSDTYIDPLAVRASAQSVQLLDDKNDDMSFEELEKKIAQSRLNALIASLDPETRKIFASTPLAENLAVQVTTTPTVVKTPSKPFVERVSTFMKTSPYANYLIAGALVASNELLNYWGMPAVFPSLSIFSEDSVYIPPCPGPYCPPT